MLNIFPCSFWPFVYFFLFLFLRNVYSVFVLFLFFNVIFSVSYWMQADLELTICPRLSWTYCGTVPAFLQPPWCWDYRLVHHNWLLSFFKCFSFCWWVVRFLHNGYYLVVAIYVVHDLQIFLPFGKLSFIFRIMSFI